MIRSIVLLAFMAMSAQSNAVFWTLKTSGVYSNIDGRTGMQIVTDSWSGPNPSSSVWVDCPSSFIYFHKDKNGTPVDDAVVNRMLAHFIYADAMKHSIRLNVELGTDGKCYTTQILN